MSQSRNHATSHSKLHAQKPRVKASAYDNFEQEEAVHERQLDTGTLGDTLEARKEAEDDRQQHEEDGEQDRWKNTLDEADDNLREVAKPRQPFESRAKSLNVGDRADECNYKDM